MRSWVSPFGALVSHTITSRSGPGYGSGRSTTRSSTVKIAVVAPTPSARATSAAMVKPGARRSCRQPNRRSCRRVSIECSAALDVPADRLVEQDSADDRCRGLRAGGLSQRTLRDERVSDRPAADEMLLNDPFENRRIAFAVPRAIGIDDGNW